MYGSKCLQIGYPFHPVAHGLEKEEKIDHSVKRENESCGNTNFSNSGEKRPQEKKGFTVVSLKGLNELSLSL